MRRICYRSIVALVLAALLAEFSWAQSGGADPPKMKMTTKIPPGIVTPDDIETRLGDLSFFDGVPDNETVQKLSLIHI